MDSPASAFRKKIKLSAENEVSFSAKSDDFNNPPASLDLRGCNFCKKYPCTKYHSPKYEKCPFQDFELSYEFSKISKITKLLRHKKPFFIANLNFLEHELLKAKNYEFLPIFQLKRVFEGFNLTLLEKYNFPSRKPFKERLEFLKKAEKSEEIERFSRRKNGFLSNDYENFQEENFFNLFKKAGKADLLQKIDICSTKYRVYSCQKHPLEQGHSTRKVPDTCDKLLCPKCSESVIEREIDDAYARLTNLSGRYWQITFTLPLELQDKVRWLNEARTIKNGYFEIKDYGVQRFFNVVYKTLKKTFCFIPVEKRGRISYVKIGEIGGLAGIHMFSTKNPAEIKPHISVILPSKMVKLDGKIEFVNFYDKVDECKRWYRYYLEQEFNWVEPNPVVEFQYFNKKKLHHKVRYLLRNPIEPKRLFQVGDNGWMYVRAGDNEEHSNDITRHEILLWDSDDIVKALKTHYAENKHRYRWFGYLSYNCWKNYCDLFHKKLIKEKMLCKCGLPLKHIGTCNENGEYVYLNYVYDFLIDDCKIKLFKDKKRWTII